MSALRVFGDFSFQRTAGLAGILLLTLLLSPVARGLENDSVTALGLRYQQNLNEQDRLDLLLLNRWEEGFGTQDRSILQLALHHQQQAWQYSAGYHHQFNLATTTREHRLWQQVRHESTLGDSRWLSSARLEERFFTHSANHEGLRLRVLNLLQRPLHGSTSLRAGYEWVLNLNDISPAVKSGLSQNRLILGLRFEANPRYRIDLEYQGRYRNLPVDPNRMQNQWQLRWTFIGP